MDHAPVSEPHQATRELVLIMIGPAVVLMSTIPCDPVVTLTATDAAPTSTTRLVSTRIITTTAIVIVTPTRIPAPPPYFPRSSGGYAPVPVPPYPTVSDPLPPYPTGTGYPTGIPSVNGTGTYVPTYAPLPTAAAGAVSVPVAMAGLIGLAALIV